VLIGLLWLIIRGGKREKIAAVLVLIAASATDATVAQIIKPAIGRLRPSHGLGDTINLLVSKGGIYGFVSAHAANIFAATTVLSYFYKQWKKPLLFLAFSVARKPRIRGSTLSWRCVVWWIIWVWDGLASNYFVGITENA